MQLQQHPTGKILWKVELRKIIDANNRNHGLRDKTVSTETKQNRADILYQAFTELRGLGFKLDNPANFRERHFKALLNHWISKGLSPSTIQKRTSVLRVFCSWIGRTNMIKGLEVYVDDVTIIRRVQVAQMDKSWSYNNVSFEDKLKEIEAYDIRAGAQLRMIKAFGLRRREAVCFRPIVAMRLGEESQSITVEFGTKGGRPRSIPVDNDEKREALANACKLSKVTNGHIGWVDLTLKQAIMRFANIMHKFGITKKDSGVTVHGLRHEYINDQYEVITGQPSPVRGGQKKDVNPEKDFEARMRLTLDAGHSRLSITPSYFGSYNKSNTQENDSLKKLNNSGSA
jgi:site-specific recombinase XerC